MKRSWTKFKARKNLLTWCIYTYYHILLTGTNYLEHQSLYFMRNEMKINRGEIFIELWFMLNLALPFCFMINHDIEHKEEY